MVIITVWFWLRNRYWGTLMKKLFLLFLLIPLLNNCSQYSAMVKPSLTLANGGSISQVSSSLVSSLAVNNVKQNIDTEMNPERYCQTIHSSELSEIFFETVDQMGCIYDPMRIYR